MKKSFVFGMFLAASMLAACGGGNSSSSASSASSSASSSAASSSAASSSAASSSVASSSSSVSSSVEVVQSYEILGSYDELYNQFAAFEFYGAMYSDGSGILYSATITSSGEFKNQCVPDEGVSFRYKVEDDEGILTLTASINGKKMTGYQNRDGDFELPYSFVFAGSYTREATLVISDEILYNDTLQSWVDATNEEYANRVPERTVSALFSGPICYADGEHEGEPWIITLATYEFNASASLKLFSDFSVEFVYGAVTPQGTYGGGTLEGTWTMLGDMTTYQVTIGDTTFNSAVVENVAVINIAFEHTSGEDTLNLIASLSYVAENE